MFRSLRSEARAVTCFGFGFRLRFAVYLEAHGTWVIIPVTSSYQVP